MSGCRWRFSIRICIGLRYNYKIMSINPSLPREPRATPHPHHPGARDASAREPGSRSGRSPRATRRAWLPHLLFPILALGGLGGLGGLGVVGGLGCSGDDGAPDPCARTVVDIETGDPDGHPEPFGARAAGEARAARVASEADIVQPRARHRVAVGDYVLVNERIAVYIEADGFSDGYSRFGGEILAVDAVGEDGRPMGWSSYGETLTGLSNEMLDPESVTVLRDGSDGGDAVVRVVGTYRKIPFLEGPMGALFSADVGLPGYLDYVLAPGEPRLQVRLGLLNNEPVPLDLSLFELYGFFHFSRNQKFTTDRGYEDPAGAVDWVAFDGGEWGFLWRRPTGRLSFGMEESGFAIFLGSGGRFADACTLLEEPYYEILAGGPELDGVLAALREVDGAEPWRAVTGTVTDHAGAPVPHAWIHVLRAGATGEEDGDYLSRTRSQADGTYAVRVPPQEAVTLVAQRRGYPLPAGVEVEPQQDSADLELGESGLIAVAVDDASTLAPAPARIQVIPDEPPVVVPESFGVVQERRGRLHQHYDVDGFAELRAPAGTHRVIVSRGYEYEVADTHMTVDATGPVEIEAAPVRSVDTTGYLCADLHVHTHHSVDSRDPPDYKVAGMVADGLDLPVFSDHEWVADPQPWVESLGLDHRVAGISSSELTTFEYGHFGIMPLVRRPELPNDGAIDWIYHTPQEVFDRVHELPEAPLIIVNHPRSDSIGGYFTAARLDRDTVDGNELYSADFDLIEAFNGSDFASNREGSVADWFALLDHGRDQVVVGSSDNHHLYKGPTGYPRTCMYFGHDDAHLVIPEDVRLALLSGDVFVSGGLYVNVRGPGGERLGETVTTADATATLTVTVQAASWVPADSLEVIVDGETTAVLTLQPDPHHAGPGQRFVHPIVVPVDPDPARRTWVVLHARGDGDLSPVHPGRRPFGVTNPIYLQHP